MQSSNEIFYQELQKIDKAITEHKTRIKSYELIVQQLKNYKAKQLLLVDIKAVKITDSQICADDLLDFYSDLIIKGNNHIKSLKEKFDSLKINDLINDAHDTWLNNN